MRFRLKADIAPARHLDVETHVFFKKESFLDECSCRLFDRLYVGVFACISFFDRWPLVSRSITIGAGLRER